MKTYTYKGLTKENHGKLVMLGIQFGIQNIRQMSIGEKIADLANNGNEKAQKTCEEHPEYFAVEL
jgi:hypothetical protein